MDNNLDLSLEFLKKCQDLREKKVPEDVAILATLQDLADLKDKKWLEKIYLHLVEKCFFTEDEAKEVCKSLKET